MYRRIATRSRSFVIMQFYAKKKFCNLSKSAMHHISSVSSHNIKGIKCLPNILAQQNAKKHSKLTNKAIGTPPMTIHTSPSLKLIS